MASKWNTNAQKEASKLGHKEADWNLPGSGGILENRTRTVKKKIKHYDDESSSDESSYHGSSSEESTTDDDLEILINNLVIAPRAIVELGSVQDLVERNTRCLECGSPVQLLYDTVTLATSFRIVCTNHKCSFIDHGDSPASARLEHLQDGRARNTDFSVNVLYVLATVANGDGPTEAGRLLGLLGLPRPATMESSNFAAIEDRIAPVIWSLHEEIMFENLTKEVEATVPPNDFYVWKQSIEGNVALDKQNYPSIRGSYDTGWNQRSSGRLYNLPSSHSFLVGARSRLPVEGLVLSKVCGACTKWENQIAMGKVLAGTPSPHHHCLRNFDPKASSGSMEPFAAAKIVNRLHNKWKTNVELICMDDDASTRTALKWSNADHMRNHNTTDVPMVQVKKRDGTLEMKERPDKGQLDGNVPEPATTADPNHRRKILTGDLLDLATTKGDGKLTMTKMDVTRLGKNYGYMIRSLPRHPESMFVELAKQCSSTILTIMSIVEYGASAR